MENNLANPPQKSGMSPVLIFLIVFGAIIIIFGGIGLLISNSLSEFNTSLTGNGTCLNRSTILDGNEENGMIALIQLEGTIRGSGSELHGDGLSYEVARRLRQAASDDDVKAVLLQVNSPGGGLTASDIMYNEVKKVKETGKPVVVWVGGMAASGGLYVSAPADWIVASPTSLVGSIGVIMQRMMVKELMEKIGVEVEPIKSTRMKDIGSPFREMTESERQYFEQLIGSFHARFVSIVADGRHLDVEKVRELASGKIYTAEQSLEYGLIDEIGYFADALAKTAELANLTDPTVIQYKEPFDLESAFKDLPFGKSKSSSQLMRQAVQTAMDLSASPGLDALWYEDIR